MNRLRRKRKPLIGTILAVLLDSTIRKAKLLGTGYVTTINIFKISSRKRSRDKKESRKMTWIGPSTLFKLTAFNVNKILNKTHTIFNPVLWRLS